MRAHPAVDGHRGGQQPLHVDLDVEVAGVGQDRTVLHEREVLGGQHLAIAGGGEEDVAQGRRLGHRQHPVPVEDCLQGPPGLDLGDDDAGSQTSCAGGDPVSAPAVARDDDGRTGDQVAGRTHDRVKRRLAGAVPVRHEQLHGGVVDRRHRQPQRAVGGHLPQPQHAGAGLLPAGPHPVEQLRPLGVQQTDEVAAVVEKHVRACPERGAQVVGVSGAVDAVPRVHGDPVDDQRRRDVVVGGQRVAGRQVQLSAAGRQGAGQRGGLGGHVGAGRDTHPLERALPDEAPGQQPEHGHGALGEVDAAPAGLRQGEVGDVGRQEGGHPAMLAGARTRVRRWTSRR